MAKRKPQKRCIYRVDVGDKFPRWAQTLIQARKVAVRHARGGKDTAVSHVCQKFACTTDRNGRVRCAPASKIFGWQKRAWRGPKG